MFNPLGMLVGFFVAQNRRVKDPVVPALVGGALPMPLGPIAAMLLAGNAPTQTAASAAVPVPPPKQEPGAVVREIEQSITRLKKEGRRGVAVALRKAAAVHELMDGFSPADQVLIGPELKKLLEAINTAPAT